jgi:hypothetical protein
LCKKMVIKQIIKQIIKQKFLHVGQTIVQKKNGYKTNY